MQNQKKKRASYVETTVQIVLILSLYKLSFLQKFYFIFFISKKISLLPDALAVYWVKLCLLLSVFISFALYGYFAGSIFSLEYTFQCVAHNSRIHCNYIIRMLCAHTAWLMLANAYYKFLCHVINNSYTTASLIFGIRRFGFSATDLLYVFHQTKWKNLHFVEFFIFFSIKLFFFFVD